MKQTRIAILIKTFNIFSVTSPLNSDTLFHQTWIIFVDKLVQQLFMDSGDSNS